MMPQVDKKRKNSGKINQISNFIVLMDQQSSGAVASNMTSGPGPKRLLPESELQSKLLLKEAWTDYKSRWGSFIWLMVATALLGILLFAGPAIVFGVLMLIVFELGGGAAQELSMVLTVLATPPQPFSHLSTQRLPPWPQLLLR